MIVQVSYDHDHDDPRNNEKKSGLAAFQIVASNDDSEHNFFSLSDSSYKLKLNVFWLKLEQHEHIN
jgi:hypothetical protein